MTTEAGSEAKFIRQKKESRLWLGEFHYVYPTMNVKSTKEILAVIIPVSMANTDTAV